MQNYWQSLSYELADSKQEASSVHFFNYSRQYQSTVGYKMTTKCRLITVDPKFTKYSQIHETKLYLVFNYI